MDSVRPLAEVEEGYTYVRDGDVVVAKITPCFENGKGAAAMGLVGGIGFGTTELAVLRPSVTLDQRFLYYLTISHEFRKLGEAEMYGAAGQKRVPDDFFRNFAVPVAPRESQRRVVDFLDREAAKINALIAKKEQMIELLQEKRAALISRAVTKGLDPNVPMKDSGIEWLGKVPTHWEFVKAGYLGQTFSGGTPSRDVQAYWGEGVPWVTPKDMKRSVIDSAEESVTEAGLRASRLSAFAPPVVLFVVRGLILVHSFPVAVTSVPVTINQDMKALRLPDLSDAKFLCYLFWGLSDAVIAQLVEDSAHGTKAIRMDRWKTFPLFLPPTPEQHAIVCHLDGTLREVNRLTDLNRELMEKLREFRTALISAAVTGKIDVREHVAT